MDINYDLRRTAARNLRRLGESEGVIMSIGGWKTRHVFERYNIKSRDDVRRATRRLDEKASEVVAQIRHNCTISGQQPESLHKEPAQVQ